MDGNCAHPLEVDQGIYDKDRSEYTEKRDREDNENHNKKGRQQGL